MSSKEILVQSSTPLTKYPLASFRELVTLSLPLIFAALSASLLGLCDRYFLSHYSLESWKACSTANPLCLLFQMTCIVIAIMAQAFVGRFQGANKKHLIGPYVWQMIWFSFISMAMTYPLSFFAESYLKGSEIEGPAVLYFRCLAAVNFLYPLGAALSSFFIGRGKTRPIFIVTLSIQVLNIVLDYFLIFGFDGIIPPLGILGAAIATIASQSSLCLTLFILFIQKKYINPYRTDLWTFKWHYLWQVLKKGVPHAFGRIMVIGSWIFASYAMLDRGGDYLLTLSFGTSLFLILSFMNEGIGQALITVTSHILGAKAEPLIGKMLRSSVIFLTVTLLLLAIPLFFYQDTIISLFIDKPISASSKSLLQECCVWIWFICLANGINRIGTSFIVASRDTLFYACAVSSLWITLCIPVFIGIGQLGWTPPKFFLLDGINTLTFGFIYAFRFRSKIWKKGLYHKIAVSEELPSFES